MNQSKILRLFNYKIRSYKANIISFHAIVEFHTTRYCWGLRGASILRWDSAETGLYHNLLGYHYILVQGNHEV